MRTRMPELLSRYMNIYSEDSKNIAVRVLVPPLSLNLLRVLFYAVRFQLQQQDCIVQPIADFFYTVFTVLYQYVANQCYFGSCLLTIHDTIDATVYHLVNEQRTEIE